MTLDEIYAKVPTIACKGLCHETCGPLVIGDAERERILRRHHTTLQHDEELTCSALTAEKRCAIYPDRPLLCRLWGVVKDSQVMTRCPYGCRPNRWLKNEKARRLMAKVYGKEGISG